MVPTLDIDLIWHAHMLSADDYVEDCERILGRVLSYNNFDIILGRFSRVSVSQRRANPCIHRMVGSMQRSMLVGS